MTDDVPSPADQPENESSDSTSNGQEGQSVDAPPKELPPGMLPLVPPVFGKLAFWITVVPFLIYWGGTQLGSYVENIRKVQPAHEMRGICSSHAKLLIEKLQSPGIPEVTRDELLDRIDMEAVSEVFTDEDSSVTSLVQRCNKLFEADLSSYPDDLADSVTSFGDYVRHWMELKDLEDRNENDEIIPEHTKFVEAHPNDGMLTAPTLRKSWYPMLYSIACISALIAVIFALPGYLKIPFRVTPLAIGVGVVGIIVWVGLWYIDNTFIGIGKYFAPNARAGFNPFEELKANPTWMYAFLGIRLLGLALVIPIAEEFFTRGFLIRYIEDIDWDQIPIGEATWKGWAGIMIYGAASHPGEILAALAWFGLIMWLYLRTKNIWDCVVAHGVTNGLLAVYVIYTDTWELW